MSACQNEPHLSPQCVILAVHQGPLEGNPWELSIRIRLFKPILTIYVKRLSIRVDEPIKQSVDKVAVGDARGDWGRRLSQVILGLKPSTWI